MLFHISCQFWKTKPNAEPTLSVAVLRWSWAEEGALKLAAGGYVPDGCHDSSANSYRNSCTYHSCHLLDQAGSQ